MSINGFSVGTRDQIGVKTFKVPNTGVYLPVRAEIAPLLIGFADEFNRKVERLVVGWNWGYAYRPVVGTTSPSFHAAAIAIDLNAPLHPLGKAGTFNQTQRATINVLCKKYGLRWGGNYISRKDEMHFEVILGRSDALALVRRLQTIPTPPAGDRWLGLTNPPMIGQDVKNVQNALRVAGNRWLVADGVYGRDTADLIALFQRNRGITERGVGPKTWAALRLVVHG